MQLYEYILNSFDKNVMLYTQKNSIDVTFVGSGYSGVAMNTYRKIVLNEHILFEKIYFNARKKSVSFFLKNILPQLLKSRINLRDD